MDSSSFDRGCSESACGPRVSVALVIGADPRWGGLWEVAVVSRALR